VTINKKKDLSNFDNKSIQDEIKFKTSNENLFYRNNPFILENKETKGESNKKLSNPKTKNENKELIKRNEIEKEENEENKIKNNNSYSFEAKNLSNNKVELLNCEDFEIPKKYNSDDLSNLWQSFPFSNKSNASKKSEKKEKALNNNSNNVKDFIDKNKKSSKEKNKVNNVFAKIKCFKDNDDKDNTKASIRVYDNDDKNHIYNVEKFDAVANHFCNIDLHNKYLTKGFSFFDKNKENPLYSGLHNNFTYQSNFLF